MEQQGNGARGGASPLRQLLRSVAQHKATVLGLLLALACDIAASATESAGGRHVFVALLVVRLVLLYGGALLAVQLGLGTCSADRRSASRSARRPPLAAAANGAELSETRAELRRPLAGADAAEAGARTSSSSSSLSVPSHPQPNGGLEMQPAANGVGSPSSSSSTSPSPDRQAHLERLEAELQRQRESLEAKEGSAGRKNVVLGVCFFFVTLQSMYTGLRVLGADTLNVLEPICLTITVFCMNAEFLLLKALVHALTQSEGVMLTGIHEHPLFYQNKPRMAWCKICRERIGPRTGGHEHFACGECEGGHVGFIVCLPCFRKQQLKTNKEEGILRGDKGPKVIPELTSAQYFWRSVLLCWDFKWTVVCAVLCVVLTQTARVTMPSYQGQIINTIIDRKAAAFQSKLIAFVVLSVTCSLFGSVQSLAVEIVQRRITCDMRTVMFESLIRQDIAFFDGTMIGQLTSRMTNDVAAVVQPVRQIMNTLFANLILLAGGLFMCFFTSWKLTVLASTMIGPVVFLTGVYAGWSKKINMKIRVSMADANAVATEALRNIRTVRSFGADDIESDRFRGHMDDALKCGMKDAYASAGVSAATRYLDFAATILILWYGGHEVIDQGDFAEISVGQLITFNLYWNMLNNSIQALNGMLNTLVRAASAAQRVFEIIDLDPDIGLEDGTACLREGEPCMVEFRDVQFAYQMRPDKVVLASLSFTIPPGQKVAVVGPSGAGKSTLVSLLLRFYDPQGGAVLLNGKPLTDYALRRYQKRVGVVSQETQVFCRPVVENLTYGMENEADVEIEEVQRAAKMANAHEFIEELDEGYKSMVGEGGVRLSGGQKQRLAIARALLRRPTLLLLDEATSALDAENEAQVQEALDKLVASTAGGCSVMLIAHRLSTVMNADKIVVVHSGKVAEQGTHQELTAREDGVYAKLVRRQIQREENTIKEASASEVPLPSTQDSSADGAEKAGGKGGGKRGKGGGKGKGKGKDKESESGGASKAADSIDQLFKEVASG